MTEHVYYAERGQGAEESKGLSRRNVKYFEGLNGDLGGPDDNCYKQVVCPSPVQVITPWNHEEKKQRA